MARIPIIYGQDHLELEVADEKLVQLRRAPIAPDLSDLHTAVRSALANPLGFPPLQTALTPDDHIVIVVDEGVARLPELVTPVVELLTSAGVQRTNVTVLCPARDAPREDLGLNGLKIEVHDPTDRRKLSYLASTKAGRRIYLNRTLVDADQLVIIGRYAYDPVLGHSGGLADVFPTFSDTATREEVAAKPSDALPGAPLRSAWNEAQEVGWLLGMPFLVQVIEGQADEHCHILAGAAAAVTKEGHRLLDERWRVAVDQQAELVIAAISGSSQSLADVTRALAHAARIVQTGGQIVVLSHATESLGPAFTALRKMDNVAQGLLHARQNKLPDAVNVWELAHAAQFAKLYLLSDMPMSTVEELFLTPLEKPQQVRKLIEAAASVVVLPDAHRTLAVLQK